jgi:X-X-X-Leu-X-X-Gly heptad repeat protein
MADYKDKIDEWQKTVRRKARELDEKYAISDLVDEGTKAAGDAAKRGAETLSSGAEKLRSGAERLADEKDFNETARRVGDDALRGAKKAGEVIRDVAGQAGKKASGVIDDASTYYDRASKVYDTGAKLTRASAAATAGVAKARDWIKENPG